MTGEELQVIGAVRCAAMTLAAEASLVADQHEGAAATILLGELVARWWAEQPAAVRMALAMTGEMARSVGVLKAS